MDLEFLMLLPLPPKCWGYRCAPLTPSWFGSGNQTHGFVYARQELYKLRSIPSLDSCL